MVDETDPDDETAVTLLSREELAERVRERTQELENVLDAMADVLLKLDESGRIEMVNDAARERLGYDPDELVGRPVDALLADTEDHQTPPEFISDSQFLDRLLDRRAVSDAAVVLAAADGDHVPVSLSTSVLTDDDGAVEGFVCVAKDIGERIERRELLELRTEQLSLLNQIVRHDIRNDVDLILQAARRLQSGEATAEERREYLDTVIDRGEHVSSVTQTARRLSEALTRGENVETSPTNVSQVLRAQAVSVADAHPEATVDHRGEFPDAVACADDLLPSVFRNLLSNAIRHNDQPEPTVTLDVSVESDEVVVTVADDGPGIPAGLRERVFEKHVTMTDRPGGGLGLYLVRTVVDNYGGSVTVTDNDPRGSVFTVRLPRADGETR